MLQQKAVMLGGIYLLLYRHRSLFPSLLFVPSFLGQRFAAPPRLSHPPFYSFSFCTSFHFPPPPNHLWVYRKAHICNNSNYLHNDLPVTKHFQIHFVFSFGWWDNSVKWVRSGCWYLFHRFLKTAQRSWAVGPRSGKPVGISLFSNPDFWAPEDDSSWNVLPNVDTSESPVPTHWVWGRTLHPQNKPPRKNLCRSSLGINSSILYLLPAIWPCFVERIGLLLFLFCYCFCFYYYFFLTQYMSVCSLPPISTLLRSHVLLAHKGTRYTLWLESGSILLDVSFPFCQKTPWYIEN